MGVAFRRAIGPVLRPARAAWPARQRHEARVAESTWLNPIEGRLTEGPDLARIELDVQGIYCSGCVFHHLRRSFAGSPAASESS